MPLVLLPRRLLCRGESGSADATTRALALSTPAVVVSVDYRVTAADTLASLSGTDRELRMEFRATTGLAKH